MRKVGRPFDLNVERVLEHWTVAHAIRELIANALDEHTLTGSSTPSINKDDDGTWHIRDYGRGIRYEHLTQNENEEKLAISSNVIGKFGVGLKDALATFDRHGIDVFIRSQHGDISIAKMEKAGFDSLATLHAIIDTPSLPDIKGTDIAVSGISDSDIAIAKDFFLVYGADKILDETKYGQVVQTRQGGKSRIYVNGLFVAEEERFLFSYNITSLTAALRKALNRERGNVGRVAYADRVKAILLECESETVAQALSDDLHQYTSGTIHDELNWNDVAVHASRILNARRKVIFVTTEDIQTKSDLIHHARSDGYQVVTVPTTVAAKLPGLHDTTGSPIRDLTTYTEEWNESFEFTFVDESALSFDEQRVLRLSTEIIRLLDDRRSIRVKEIQVSETMRPNQYGHDMLGLWESQPQRIVIKRSILSDRSRFAGVFLHELAHAYSGATDLTNSFENELTTLLGKLADAAILQN